MPLIATVKTWGDCALLFEKCKYESSKIGDVKLKNVFVLRSGELGQVQCLELGNNTEIIRHRTNYRLAYNGYVVVDYQLQGFSIPHRNGKDSAVTKRINTFTPNDYHFHSRHGRMMLGKSDVAMYNLYPYMRYDEQ